MFGATKGEKAALVNELREEGYALKHLLEAMKLSKSTYYFEIGKTNKVQERNMYYRPKSLQSLKKIEGDMA